MRYQILENLDASKLSEIQVMIGRVIDFEDSAFDTKVSVKPGIDEPLDDLKRFFGGLEDFLTKIVNSVRDTLPVTMRQVVQSCLFVPQVGFLLAINENTGEQTEFEHNSEWKMFFKANECVMYKNEHMRELDARFGDLHSEINGMCLQ